MSLDKHRVQILVVGWLLSLVAVSVLFALVTDVIPAHIGTFVCMMWGGASVLWLVGKIDA